MGDPDISVVIATRNRETRLRFALEALARQTLPSERFEVVVVRASDADGPTVTPPPGLPVRFLDCRPGPAAQRNVGWRAANASLIAFTDDDCRPVRDWLERLLAAADHSDGILQGRTEPDPDERHLFHGRARSIEIIGADDWYATCNIAYQRRTLEGLGGFDERFPVAWGEDTDLGLRAREEGAELTYVPDALVYHAVNSRTVRQAVREAAKRNSLPMVFARHPGQRKRLYMGFFVKRSHAKFLLAALGVAAFRRRPLLGAAAAFPYLRERKPLTRVPRELPRIAYHLPSRVIVDAVEVASVAASAIRHRVPVI
jgi:GT2 family glycosyltransferase